MTEPRLCPRCSAPIPVESPGGLCPACLLQAGFESQPQVTVQPTVPPTLITPQPGTGFVPPSVEEMARLFPQLEILELLGSGGMGAVYKARQPGLDRLVALKILPAEISQDPTFADRFQREARALARLNHPHIVSVYDFGQTSAVPPEGGTTSGGANRLYYFIMEFVDGANLRQMIRGGKLSPKEALAIVPQVCDALQFAHEGGVVHRDIKPENILIDKKGRVKIADFGLAKLLGESEQDHSLTATHQVMGTLRYMAPEQMQGSREVDHRADIYSLGVVFYELLTGELPMGRFSPPSKKVQIDVRLDEVVLRALEQDPEQRYQSASDVKLDMESISRTPQTFSSTKVSPANPVATTQAHSTIRNRLRGPAITLMLYGLAILFPVVVCFFNGLDIIDGNDRSSVETGWGLIGLSGILLVMAGLVLRGGWHMLALESYRAALLGTFLGQPIGLWGLFVLSRTEVKSAFVVAERRVSDEPRLSRSALWAGILGCLGLISICISFLLVTTVTETERRTPASEVTVASDSERLTTAVASAITPVPERRAKGPPYWGWILAVSTGVIAAAAPFGTTILGGVAMAQIKRSSGRIYGLPLAVADALLYPLLLLDLLIMAFVSVVVMGLILIASNVFSFTPRSPLPIGLAEIATLILSVPLIVWIDYLIVSRVWRSATDTANRAPLDKRRPRAGRIMLLVISLLAVGVASLLCGTVIVRTWGFDERLRESPTQDMLMVLVAIPIAFLPARAIWRGLIGPRDAFSIDKVPLIGQESVLGRAALTAAILAIVTHAWPWMWILPPNSSMRVISNFDVIDAEVSALLLALSIGAALFAAAPGLIRPIRKIVRLLPVIAASAALVVQVRFYMSLGEYEPGGTVVRITRSFTKIGIYNTLAMTAITSLLFLLRWCEEMFETPNSVSERREGEASGR